MAIKATVENLDDVPSHFHELYTESNGVYVLTGVEGIKPQAEFDRVYGSLTKERNDHKQAKTALAAFNAFGDIGTLQAALDRIPELEAAAAGKLDDVAINKLVETRIGTKLAPVERERQALAAKLAETQGVIEQYVAKERTRSIHDTLREVLKKHEGFQPSAFDDAAMLAERVFEVDEDGRVTAKEGVGCTPGVDVAVWLTEMQTKRPHWWGTSSGGGAKGSQGGGGTGPNPFSADGWNLTLQGQMIRENPARAEQMARSAGTSVGGGRPMKK